MSIHSKTTINAIHTLFYLSGSLLPDIVSLMERGTGINSLDYIYGIKSNDSGRFADLPGLYGLICSQISSKILCL